MTTGEIIEKIISRDTHKVWEAACKIIELGRDREKIAPLIEYLPLITEKTGGLDMGGGFANNQRFIDYAITTIEFHKNNQCPCGLYVAKYTSTHQAYLNKKIQYECTNPNREVEKGNIKILDIVRIEEKWVDYYLVECLKCGTKYKVEEREGHYMWWHWIKIKKRKICKK